MSDRSPAGARSPENVLACHFAALDDTYVHGEHEVAGDGCIAALEAAGYVISRPGDPWVDADGRRWEVERFTDGATPESAHLWPEDDGTPDEGERRRIAGL